MGVPKRWNFGAATSQYWRDNLPHKKDKLKDNLKSKLSLDSVISEDAEIIVKSEAGQALNNQVLKNQAFNNQALKNQAFKNQAFKNQAFRTQDLNNQAFNDNTQHSKIGAMKVQAVENGLKREGK